MGWQSETSSIKLSVFLFCHRAIYSTLYCACCWKQKWSHNNNICSRQNISPAVMPQTERRYVRVQYCCTGSEVKKNHSLFPKIARLWEDDFELMLQEKRGRQTDKTGPLNSDSSPISSATTTVRIHSTTLVLLPLLRCLSLSLLKLPSALQQSKDSVLFHCWRRGVPSYWVPYVWHFADNSRGRTNERRNEGREKEDLSMSLCAVYCTVWGGIADAWKWKREISGKMLPTSTSTYCIRRVYVVCAYATVGHHHTFLYILWQFKIIPPRPLSSSHFSSFGRSRRAWKRGKEYMVRVQVRTKSYSLSSQYAAVRGSHGAIGPMEENVPCHRKSIFSTFFPKYFDHIIYFILFRYILFVCQGCGRLQNHFCSAHIDWLTGGLVKWHEVGGAYIA